MTANNTPFKDLILKICLLKNGTWSKEVKFRAELAAPDLHAADPPYHQECNTNFLHLSYLDRLAKTPEKDKDNTLPCVIKLMKANEKGKWNIVYVAVQCRSVVILIYGI